MEAGGLPKEEQSVDLHSSAHVFLSLKVKKEAPLATLAVESFLQNVLLLFSPMAT